MNPPPSDLVLFLGRFHPLLVHLPIGFVVLLAALELIARRPRFQQAGAARGVIAALAVPAAALSVGCGLLLSEAGGYDARLLAWHKWTGIGVAGACLLTFLLHWWNRAAAYRVVLFATVAVLAVASHFGGSLTHGSDYLVRHAPAPLRAWLGGKPPPPPASGEDAGVSVFATAVQPVLDKYCVNCHGPEKSKGDLRLDSLETLRKGGEHGPVLEPGRAAASVLIKRLLLPLSDEDHMPPEGKPQPSADDIALLQWWIDAGAPGDKTAADLKPPENIARILKAKSSAPAAGSEPASVSAPPAPPAAAPQPRETVLPVAGDLAAELGIVLSTMSQTEPWLQGNASPASTNFGDAELARLAPLAANLRWLDLGRTRVTDTGLVHVAAMNHLTRLHLEHTSITDAGLAHLTGLRELEYLNLYGTAVTDAGLAHLRALPKLRQLYLWQTRVTPEAAKQFADARVDKDQIARWQAEIEALRARINSQGVVVELGAPTSAAAAPRAGPIPINTICPVSGKLADRTQTTLHEGRLVAFCCNDCKATFEKDPKPHLARLAQLAQPPPGDLSRAKPINTRCPVSDKPVDPAKTVLYEGRVIAFCCDDCKARFTQNPGPCLAKLGLPAPADNTKKEQKP